MKSNRQGAERDTRKMVKGEKPYDQAAVDEALTDAR